MTTTVSTSLLDRVQALLGERHPDDALELLGHSRDDSAAVRNARAVCLMRLGRAEEAVHILGSLVFVPGSVAVRDGAPERFKLNLATAMLMTGNVAGAVHMLDQLDERSPEVRRLRDAIAAWRKKLPIWTRLAMRLGATPYDRPVPLDFAPGHM